VLVGAGVFVAGPQADRTSIVTIMRLRKPQLNFLDDILFLLVYENLGG
jgi:hypothetical protein